MNQNTHPLYVTCEPALYVELDEKAGAVQVGSVNPVPPAALSAFLIAKS